MSLSSFWRGVIAVGSALGLGLAIAIFSKKKLPPPPDDLDSPIDEENCSRKFFPSPNQNARSSSIDWIVLHDTEGGDTAAQNASYFMNPSAKVSAHIIVDDSGACYRSVADDAVAWAAQGANPRSLNIEMVAPAGAAVSWSEDDWLARDKMLEVSAAHVARWAEEYGIPTRFVDAAGLARGDRGITTHAEVTRAGMGGDHVDPGPNFPIEDFIKRVNTYAKVA